MSQRLIQDDERWPAFVRRYANDLAAFAREVCGMEVDEQLARAFENVQMPDCRVSMASDLNSMQPGVISPLAPIAFWRLLCRPESLTMVAAPFGDMLRCCERYSGLVKSFVGANSWALEYLRLSSSTMMLKQQGQFSGAGVRFMAASEHYPERMAGFCGRDVMWLMEDASAMAAVSFQVVREGLNLCGDGGMVLHSGRGLRKGFFRETQTTLSCRASGSNWKAFVLNATQDRKPSLKVRQA
ncbi:hypothetical protein [Pseudomonas sp. TWP3-2]|uniref:hypothetical protein n=1 Tax=Pseudomonas sp. TWP3-2 TaxID=2804574 RepID=UPI003CF1680D